jgi:hypothetical protein
MELNRYSMWNCKKITLFSHNCLHNHSTFDTGMFEYTDVNIMNTPQIMVHPPETPRIIKNTANSISLSLSSCKHKSKINTEYKECLPLIAHKNKSETTGAGPREYQHVTYSPYDTQVKVTLAGRLAAHYNCTKLGRYSVFNLQAEHVHSRPPKK